ncbi:hypothetical protein [Paraburkholderia caffeinilytica]|uniref:hypothetical protein n=1 Tax=Paraburkholderia caffeinilytica TaxID=1761016 RepID=UPI0038BD10B5
MKYNEKFFKTTKFAEAQSWVFAALGGASLAFFFAMLSASDQMLHATSVKFFAEPLFCISLISSSTFAFIIKISGDDAELIHRLNCSSFFGWIPVIAIWSFLFGTLAVLCAFSIALAIPAIASLAFSYFAFVTAIKKG